MNGMNSLTLIMEFETSVMKLNDFFHAPVLFGASWGHRCRHLIVQHVDLTLAHISYQPGINLVANPKKSNFLKNRSHLLVIFSLVENET
jgi:hypothetical protein